MEQNKIQLPSWRDGIPEKDSRLFHKVSTSKNYSIIYLYMCEKFQSNDYKLFSVKVAKDVRMDRAYVYQILTDFANFGYLKKCVSSNNQRIVFFVPSVAVETFIRQSLIDEAKKYCVL